MKFSSIKFLAAFVLFSGLTAQAVDFQLTANLNPNKGILIPANGKNCQESVSNSNTRSLKSPYVVFNDFKMSWSGPGTLDLSYISVKIQSPELVGGEYKEYIESDQFNFDGSMKEGTTFTSPCGFRFGNVEFVNPKNPAHLKGTITLIGMALASNSLNDDIVEVTLPFELEYPGKQ